MNKLASASRADLLRSLQRGEGEEAARFFGFRRVRAAEPEKPSVVKFPDHVDESINTATETAPQPAPKPAERMKFLFPVRTKILGEDVVAPDDGLPISDRELAIDPSKPELPFAPLARWSRLAPYLKERLGVRVVGERLDLGQLMRTIARCEPVLEMPRRRRVTWASQALILWDETPEMSAYQRDLQELWRRLRRERGRHGLRLARVRGRPSPALLGRTPPDAPVLAVSAMGQLVGSSELMDSWRSFAARLAFRRHPFHALSPCPPFRWQPALVATWPTACWDRRARLPRAGGSSAFAQTKVSDPEVVELLLDLLAPASRVEPPLLRAVRLLLGSRADVGTESDAWRHADCWAAPECFGFLPGEGYASRLRRRREWKGELAALARRADLLINRDHARYSVVIAIEAKLRACFTASASPERLGEAGGVLRSAVVRLRKLAESPGSRTGQRTGLAKWFDGLMGRLPEEMLADSTVADWLARGLALCDHFAEQETRELPRGLDAEVYREELRRAASKGWSITECALGLDSDNESPQQPFLLPREGDERRKCLPLTLFRRAGRSLQIGYEASAQTWRHARFSHPPEAAPLPLPSSPVSFHLSSYWQELWFDALQRPSWARRMWYDRYGLAAEFRVGETPFVLRWIPPGRFLMGSPEAEPGWSKAEGPQHEVVISRGFWLGETPVTQVQWRAVVENAGKAAAARGLEPSPSHFSGPDTLPVEQVSWPEARDFCSLMEGALVDSPGFRLPTEAEWEYACRAGMVDALWSGPIKIEADHDAPALEEIAWYVGNSWRDLEVEKPFAMKDLPWKHPKGNRAGAHRVKGKEANPWGLYDMLGNVWEWCRDAWNDEAYQRRERLTYDPMVRIDDVAERVVRGGSWSDLAQDCRSAYRDGNPPGSRIHGLGFRLAAGQEPEAAEPPGAERPTARERAAGRRPTAPSRGAARRRPAK